MVPIEYAVGGVFMPPLLVAGLLGGAAAIATGRLLNRFRLSRYLFYPPLVLVALTVLYTVLIGTLFIPV